jgi:uncharacterized membrane protein
VLLAVIGAALIGAGVILLIAHNWDGLGRPVRMGLSLLPLLVASALSIFTGLRRFESTAWRESAGVAQVAGIGASIALVSQTYHIEGNLSDFLFTWLVLAIPVPYLLRAVCPAVAYLAGIAFWAGTVACDYPWPQKGAPGYWLFLAAMLPFYFGVLRKDRLGKPAAWLSAVLGISAGFGLGFCNLRDAWMPAFSGFFATGYLAGALGFPEKRLYPLRALGGLGIAVLTVVFSFTDVWTHLDWLGKPWTVYALAGGFPLAGLALAAFAWERRADFNRLATGFPLLVVAVFLLNKPVAGAVAFSLYGVALALATAFRGLRDRAFATLNGGLLLFAALLIARFADSEFGTLERGLAFIGLGVLMLGANLWMLKSKKEVAR